MKPAKLIRVHLSEADKHDERPLYEAIVDLCRTHQIAGATAFRGLEGFSDTAIMHRSHLIATDAPLSVVIVDSEDKIRSLLPELEALVGTALIAVSDVQMKRVEEPGNAP